MKTDYEVTKRYNEKRTSEGWIRRTFFYPEEIMKKIAKVGKTLYLKHKLEQLKKEGNE